MKHLVEIELLHLKFRNLVRTFQKVVKTFPPRISVLRKLNESLLNEVFGITQNVPMYTHHLQESYRFNFKSAKISLSKFMTAASIP